MADEQVPSQVALSSSPDAVVEGADNNASKSRKKKKEELDSTSIYVKIYSAYQVFFDGPAMSISAENDTGPFDILPRHHNFITLVNAGEIIVRVDNADDTRLRIAKGIMHVRSNKITVFLDV